MTQQGLTRLHFVTFLQQRWLVLCTLGMAACWSGTKLSAQDSSTQAVAIPTLHVQANLVQIPVLVLTPAHEKLSSPIAANRFSINFNGGRGFRPKYARLEGDDPIDLAIVLDTRRPQSGLLPQMDQAIAGLAPSFLRSHDHVSIYAIDCSVMHAVEDVPAEPRQLKEAVDIALHSWTEHRQSRNKSTCNPNVHLWDSLAYVTHLLSGQAGRRVVLAITNGDDWGSKRKSDDLAHMAQTDGVTIFALNPTRETHLNSALNGIDQERLSTACELSGGIMLGLNDEPAAKRMQRFTEMLRERYILEFRRPSDAKAGRLEIAVQIDGADTFIRPAGDGIPIDGSSMRADSNMIEFDPSIAPPPDDTSASVAAAQTPATPPVEAPPIVVPPPVTVSVVAQEPTVPPQTPPSTAISTIKVSTRLTVEDVTVADERRVPVHGLLRSDFFIKEDGKPQTIRNFEEYGTERPSTQAASPQLPSNVYTNAQPPAPTTSAINIILLDSVSTGVANGLSMAPENLLYAKQQSMKYLKKMPPGTRVAILQLGSTVRVLQGLTSDKDILLAAMNSISFKPVPGAYVSLPRSQSAACMAANTQSRLTVDALDEVAAFLAGIPGRKNLIWFTPGTPWLTDYPTFSVVGCLNDYTPQLHRAYGLLTAARVALYPVDPRGLFSDPSVAASSVLKISPGTPVREAAAFGGNTTGEHNSLQAMADATGGVAYFNRNDLDAAVGEAITTGADYYSLSYVPPLSKYDGKYHTVDVKVDRPGLRLQYRAGYTSVDPTHSPEPAEKKSSTTAASPKSEFPAAMGHDVANSTQLLFDVRVTPSTASPKSGDSAVIGSLNPMLKSKPLVRYAFLYALSGDQITLVDGIGGTRNGSVEFVIAAYNAEGEMLNLLSQTAKLTLKPDEISQFIQGPFRMPLQFDLPSGHIFVRIGVRDASSEKMGTLEIPMTVAK